MANMQELETFLREERFMRLVQAYEAARRWELWRSTRLFRNRLVALGANEDADGCWRLGAAPAAYTGSPVGGE